MEQTQQPTAAETTELGGEDGARPRSDAARKRAAVEIVARHEATLKRTARRYSLDAADAEDAYQRALEIVLTKAPTTDLRELIRWTQTVTKHEALAVREGRERLLGSGHIGEVSDPVARIPARLDGPDEQAERREAIARSREALRALKPAELRALTLRAEGYSYTEISELTGFSKTKINRVLVEGRERFRELISNSEDGTRCRELRQLLSAFCDGETSQAEEKIVREHLRACAGCRSTMRAYREAPRIAVALLPALPPSRSLLERAQDLLGGLSSRMPGIGGGGDPTVQIAAAGSSRGLSMAALAKLFALCAGAAGGAACVATGIVPAPLDLSAQHSVKPSIERSVAKPRVAATDVAATDEADHTTAPEPTPTPAPQPDSPLQPRAESASAEPASTPPAEATEYEAPPPAAPEPAATPAPPPSSEPPSSSSASGSAAGEFGP